MMKLNVQEGLLKSDGVVMLGITLSVHAIGFHNNILIVGNSLRCFEEIMREAKAKT
jgi:hypothetical protein